MSYEEEPVIPTAVKRAGIVLGVLLLLLISLLVVRGYFKGRQIEANLAHYASMLDDPDPRQRLSAAELVLESRPSHEPAMLTAAGALLELRDPLRAREMISGLSAPLGSDLSRRLALLRSEAYLQEAQGVIDSMTRNNTDMAQQNMDQILESIEEQRAVLGDQAEAAYQRRLLEARALDVRALMLHTMMSREATDLARAQVVAFEEQVELMGVRVSDLRGQVEAIERRLGVMCRDLLKDEAHQDWPRLLLFRSEMRSGDLAEARQLATQVAMLSPLDATVAGEMAWTLLNFDATGSQAVTTQDVDLARRLIEHADVEAHAMLPLSLRMARASLELRQGQAEQAVEAIGQLQRDYPLVTALQWLLGRALVQADRPAQAVTQLTPVVERVNSAQGRHVLALALLAVGDSQQAQEQLSRSLDLDSQNLSARIELARQMLAEGLVAEADPEIQAANAINAGHPQVMSLTCQLMVHRKDAKGLRQYIEGHVGDGRSLTPRHVEMAAAMALDDRSYVQQSIQGLQGSDWDWLATLAHVWVRSNGAARSQVAAIVAVTMIPAINSEPLRQVEDPPLESVRHAAMIDASAELPVAPLSPMEPLVATRFFPFPQQLGVQLVDRARERWPREPSLLLWSAQLRPWLGDLAAARRDLRHALELDSQLATRDPVPGLQALLSDDLPALQREVERTEMTRTPTTGWLALTLALRQDRTDAVAAVLTHLLKQGAWCELAVLEAIRDARLRGQERQVDIWLQLARTHNPPMGLVLTARVDLSRGEAAQAIERVAALVQEGDDDSLARGMAVDVSATAMLALGQFESTSNLVESMSFTAEAFKSHWMLAGLDAMIESQRGGIAASAAVSLINQNEWPPHLLDQLLARVRALHEPQRVERLAASMLTVKPDDALAQYYRAVALLADNDLVSARQLLATLLRRQPDARRVRLMMARLETLQGQPDAARAVLEPMLSAGGADAQAAQRELDGAVAVQTPGVVP